MARKKTCGGALPLAALLLVLALGGELLQAQTNPRENLSLMPIPKSVELGSGQFAVNGPFTFGYASFHDGRLERAVDRMERQLAFETGTEMSLAPVKDAAQAKLVLDVRGPGERVQSIDEDESYSLKVDALQVHLQAATDVGAMRGLETLLQLITLNNGRYVLPAVSIEDAPRFRWRGLLLDCARHFEPEPVILRTLDGMAAVKLNVFHWHLSDDQAFRVESKKFPKLQLMGSSDGLFYTQEQVRQVVAYARDRGIRVVPEFDMPAHTYSYFTGYPYLAIGPGPYQPFKAFSWTDRAMDPTRASTYRFIDALVGEMAPLFPDAYFDIGGDEFTANPAIVAAAAKRSPKSATELQRYFNQQIFKIVKKHGKLVEGWGEILHTDSSKDPALQPVPKDAAIEVWNEPELVLRGARHGDRMIYSDAYYLNFMYPAERYYLADPVRLDTLLQGPWANSRGAKRYLQDLRPSDKTLTAEDISHILGGEVSMWGELVTPATVDSVIWPRAAAVAERFWSPENVRDVNDMYRRLSIESLRLEQVGLTHISGPQKMLRNLAGNENPKDLSELVSILEPPIYSVRLRARAIDQLTPLDRLADAVIPDPPARHQIELEVNALLSDPQHQSHQAEFADRFQHWQRLSSSLEPLLSASPRMSDAAPLAPQLSQLGALGLTALHYLDSGQSPTEAWRQNALTLLTQSEKPVAGVTFTFLQSLRQLVLACAGSSTSSRRR